MNATTRNTTTKQLQGIGRVPAIAYRDARPGDVLVYNYGSRYTVAACYPISRSTVRVVSISTDGSTFTNDRRADTTVGIYTPADDDAIVLEACPASERYLSIND